ncbi:hypothetical protein ACFQ8O_24720 [Streptomyces coelicoflavus]
MARRGCASSRCSAGTTAATTELPAILDRLDRPDSDHIAVRPDDSEPHH